LGPEVSAKPSKSGRRGGNSAEEEKFSFTRSPNEYRTAASRVLKTYVNSKKCASISSSTRGVLSAVDGRFAAQTEVCEEKMCFKKYCRESRSVEATIWKQ
jgi:hypothetical protein